MAVPIVLSPAATYATKPNIRFPGTQAQATAAEAAAQQRINDVLPSGVSVTVGAGTVPLAR